MKVVYNKNEYCVPVTKSATMEEIEFIIEDFLKKKVTFCIGKTKTGYEIWRKEESGDIDNIKKRGSPEKPVQIFVEGEKADEIEVIQSN